MYTDNNLLTYVMTSAKLNSTGYCWITDLVNFNFDIKYPPAVMNKEGCRLSFENAKKHLYNNDNNNNNNNNNNINNNENFIILKQYYIYTIIHLYLKVVHN